MGKVHVWERRNEKSSLFDRKGKDQEEEIHRSV